MADRLGPEFDRQLENLLAKGYPELAGLAPSAFAARITPSILGSRRGDRRVPALWLSAGSPRLGWCWAGNPHTWLGSASCAGRLGVVS